MIPDLIYISKDLYAFNQVRSRPTYLSDPSLYIRQAWGPLVYIPGGLCHLVNALTNEADVCIKEKS